MRRKNVLLSTTSSLEGWEVQEYFGPVSAKLVIGTGLLTEVFSAWTDFFGTSSQSYQNKLDQIEEHALGQLTEKAWRRGATAVLGLRVDHDEISGGGKSMLMVTAMGTAVRAVRTRGKITDRIQPSSSVLSAEALAVALRRQSLVAAASAGKLDLSSESVWSFLLEYRVSDVLPQVLDWADRVLRPEFPGSVQVPAGREKDRNRVKDYLHVLPDDDVSGSLHASVARSEHLAKLAREVIAERHLLEYTRVLPLLGVDDTRAAARALQLLTADPAVYTASDLEALRAVEAAIPKMARIPAFAKKRLLGGTSEVWSCLSCGVENAAEHTTCSTCSADVYACRKGELNPSRAQALVNNKLRLLELHFAVSE